MLENVFPTTKISIFSGGALPRTPLGTPAFGGRFNPPPPPPPPIFINPRSTPEEMLQTPESFDHTLWTPKMYVCMRWEGYGNVSSSHHTTLLISRYAVRPPATEQERLFFVRSHGWSVRSIDFLSLLKAFWILSAAKRATGWFAQHPVISFVMVERGCWRISRLWSESKRQKFEISLSRYLTWLRPHI